MTAGALAFDMTPPNVMETGDILDRGEEARRRAAATVGYSTIVKIQTIGESEPIKHTQGFGVRQWLITQCSERARGSKTVDPV